MMGFVKGIFFCVGAASALSPVVLTSDQEIVDGTLTRVDTRAMDQRRRLGASSANLLDAVAKATVSGDIAYSWEYSGPHATSSGEDIVGPFEAGFSATQDDIIEAAFGCSDTSKCYSDGGTDTKIAQATCAHLCGIDLPKCETASGDAVDCADADFATDVRFAFLDTCGGHTRQYHFHQFMECLYDVTAAGHSAKIGEGEDAASTPLYGKYEATGEVPLLDACGAHFGITPDSDGASVYHHHVQENPPFTYGCYGPNDDGSLVSVETCRSLYDDCVEDDGSRRLQQKPPPPSGGGAPPDSGGSAGGGNGESIDIETAEGTIRYTPWCPCYDGSGEGYDGAGLNTGVDIVPLAVFAGASDPTTPRPTQQPIEQPTSAPVVPPSPKPTQQPVEQPMAAPVVPPSPKPTRQPVAAPTASPVTQNPTPLAVDRIDTRVEGTIALAGVSVGINHWSRPAWDIFKPLYLA